MTDDVVTPGGDDDEQTLGLQGTLPQGYVYTKVDDPDISAAQFRQNNQEIADGGQSVIWTDDDDSSVQSVSSVPSSDGDGHSGCGRGEPCPDNHVGFFPFGDDELPVEEVKPGQEGVIVDPLNVRDFMNVAQELFPKDQSSEIESSGFETNDEVAVVGDLYRPE